ncbi:protein LIAT1 [Latimeria chalumnae]|uniref:protein LIAT1 n=1 Tax=Latimeria chalumnae TaxID=7897 RepID=UPI0003C15441
MDVSIVSSEERTILEVRGIRKNNKCTLESPSLSEKKKKKRKEKEKKKLGSKKRGHSDTPSPSNERGDKPYSSKHQPPSTPCYKPNGASSKTAATDPSKKLKKVKEGNKVPSSSCSSFISVIDDELSKKFNESLRWDGVLTDPTAEEERIQKYKMNRRKRYLAAQHSFYKDLNIPVGNEKNLFILQKQNPYIASNKEYQMMTKTDHSNSYFLGNKDSAIQNTELTIKMPDFKSSSSKLSQVVR